MLTQITIRNFKSLDEVRFELGDNVVLIGPNNSGKSTILQALAVWETGLRRWNEKREFSKAKKRTGVSINRNDLWVVPVPDSVLLWKDLHTRKKGTQPKSTDNIRFDITIEGITNNEKWLCGLEFDYSNSESLLCRPIRREGFEFSKIKDTELTDIPPEALREKIAYLPPMSGLAAREFRKEKGEINVMLGEGQTAQVLRNLCHEIYSSDRDNWKELQSKINRLFGVELSDPEYIPDRSEIRMNYFQRKNGPRLDLSCSGRGLQQALLILAHLYSNPKSVLLLDEPDAHLEILRQREIYQVITETAKKQKSQVIIASHSEVILNEAADRDIVIACIGKPHRIDDRGTQVLKSLKEIGFDQYALAEQQGWILYLEGSTDLAILRAFSKTLNHQVSEFLERCFVHYVANQPQKARDHFYGLLEAKQDLIGIAIFDKLDKNLRTDGTLFEMMWGKKEIENYLCQDEVLMNYSLQSESMGELFRTAQEKAMREAIDEVSSALKTLRSVDPWSDETKSTDDFLDPVFRKYFEKLQLPNLMRKTDYHVLAGLVPKEKIATEVTDKLDKILEIAQKAQPRKA